MIKEQLIAKQDFVYLMQTANSGLKKQMNRSVAGKKVRLVTIERSDAMAGRQIGGQIVSFIIGSDVEDPVRSAQRLHALEKNAKIILLAKSRKSAEVFSETIRFTPFLGSNVSCLDELEMETLDSMLRQSLKAGRYRAIIEETNSQLSITGTAGQQAFNQQFINKLMDIAPIGIAIVSRVGNVLGWNREAAAIFGKHEAQVLGTPLVELFEGTGRTKLERYIARSFNKTTDGGPDANLELYRRTTDESEQVLTCTAALFNNTGEAQDVIVLTIKDITVRKEAETKLWAVNKTLAKQAKKLAASNADLEQFAYVASHDLQEPLRMITGFLTQLEKKYDDVLDDKGRKYIYFATDGARRMRQIIMDLLEFSRVGREDYQKEPVDLNALVEDVLLLNKKIIEEINAKIEIDDLPEIFAAKGSMRQLFMNLINNALKYHEKGARPVVKVTSEEKRDKWLISISDNGIGIHPDYSEKIFTIFQRLHDRSEYEGTGMGLAICKKIVDEHGGKIGVKSEEGKGSTFYFSIEKNQCEIENNV